MKVRDPHGQTWRVTRRWVPWRPRRRNVDGDFSGGLDFDDGLVIGIVVAIVLLVLVPLLLPFVILGLEGLLVLVVLPLAVLGRAVFGRKWTVEVRRGFRPYAEEQTGTWNDATVRIRELAADLERGTLPTQTLRRAAAAEAASE